MNENAINELQQEMRAGFHRIHAELARVNEQLMKIRTTDFRILLGVNLTAAIGTFLIFVKMLG